MFFFFNDAPPPEIYPLPLHAALPISDRGPARRRLAEGARRLSRAVAIAQPGAGERAARHRGAARARAGGSGGGLGAAQSGGYRCHRGRPASRSGAGHFGGGCLPSQSRRARGNLGIFHPEGGLTGHGDSAFSAVPSSAPGRMRRQRRSPQPSTSPASLAASRPIADQSSLSPPWA